MWVTSVIDAGHLLVRFPDLIKARKPNNLLDNEPDAACARSRRRYHVARFTLR